MSYMKRTQQTYEEIDKEKAVELPYTYMVHGETRTSTVRLSIQKTLPSGDIGLHISKGSGNGQSFKVFSGIVLPVSLKQSIGQWLYNVETPVIQTKVATAEDLIKGMSKKELIELLTASLSKK